MTSSPRAIVSGSAKSRWVAFSIFVVGVVISFASAGWMVFSATTQTQGAALTEKIDFEVDELKETAASPASSSNASLTFQSPATVASESEKSTDEDVAEPSETFFIRSSGGAFSGWRDLSSVLTTDDRPIGGPVRLWLQDLGLSNVRRAASLRIVTDVERSQQSFNRQLPYLALMLSEDHWRIATDASARGLTLAAPGGCQKKVVAHMMRSELSANARNAFVDQCREIARRLRDRLAAPPAELNQAASDAWEEAAELLTMLSTSDERDVLTSLATSAE